MHQSDYCMQTSVLKLSDTKKGTNMAIAFHYLLAFFGSLFSRQAFSSKAAPQSVAQIKDHTAMCNLDLIVSHDL